MSVDPAYPWNADDILSHGSLNSAIAMALNKAEEARQAALTAQGTANGAVNAGDAYEAKSRPVTVTASWAGVNVASGTIILTGYVPYSFRATAVYASVGSAGGSFDCQFRADGVNLGSLGTVSVNQQARQTFLATGSNLDLGVGSLLDVVITVTGGLPKDGWVTLVGVRT